MDQHSAIVDSTARLAGKKDPIPRSEQGDDPTWPKASTVTAVGE